MATLSEKIFRVRRFLENDLNTYSNINLDTKQSVQLIEVLSEIEMIAIQLERCVIPDTQRMPEPTESSKIILMDKYRARKGGGKCSA